jgi:SAM-dependent methyltransferase
MSEKEYMKKSWKEEKHQSYKSDDIDTSVQDFYKFLKSRNVSGTLLDIGCGNGKNTIYFQKKGFNSRGIDFARSAIDICKENAKELMNKPEFKMADILNYNSGKKYDVVLDCGCLHHIKRSNWNKYKKTILDNLKVGGYFYLHGISGGDANKVLSKHPKKRNWIINKKGHYTTFLIDKDINKLFGKRIEIKKSFEFKSANSPLTVKAFIIKRI